jgi:hypothetical protein
VVLCAFVLESFFRLLAAQLVGCKTIVLYLVCQTFQVLLALAAAYVVFGGRVFPLPAVGS